MAEQTPDLIKANPISQPRRRREVAQAMRVEASVRWQPSPLAESMEDLHEMPLLKRATAGIHKQEILGSR